ncbi:hypothetical protein RI054_24g103740 [Pseudoscourfieldia marina]
MHYGEYFKTPRSSRQIPQRQSPQQTAAPSSTIPPSIPSSSSSQTAAGIAAETLDTDSLTELPRSWIDAIPDAMHALCPPPLSSSFESAATIRNRQKLRAAAKLLSFLPRAAFAKALGISLDQLHLHEASEIVRLMLLVLRENSSSLLDRVRRVIVKYRAFCIARGLSREEFSDGVIITTFLHAEDQRARYEASLRNDNTTGASVQYSTRSAFVWLNHFGVVPAVDAPVLAPSLHGVPHIVPQPTEARTVPSFSVRIVASLERLSQDSTQSQFVRCTAAAFVAMTLSCGRFEQSQQSRLSSSSGGFRRGDADADKATPD